MSLLETYKQQIRTEIPSPIEKQEWRFTRYGLLTATQEMTASPDSIISDDLRVKAADSEGMVLKIPVYKIGDVTISAVRSCAIGDLDNTTELIDVVWTTLVADISMKKAEYHKNEVTYLKDLSKKLQRADNAMAKAVEQLIFTKLDTEKSGVYGSPLVGVGADYQVVADTLQVPLADQELFFNDMETIMEGDDFYSMPFKVMGSTSLKPSVKHFGNQGASNDENLTYQFDAYDFRFSNHVPAGAGVKSVGFCMPNGSLGIMSRIAIDSRMGNKSSDGSVWDVTQMDRLGMQVGTLYRSTCKDLSAATGLEHLTATMVENWQFSIDIALVTDYNSDPVTLAGAIKKFEFLIV